MQQWEMENICIKMYTLHKDVYRKCIPPFPTTRLLRLTSIAKCDTWALVLKMYTRGLYQA